MKALCCPHLSTAADRPRTPYGTIAHPIRSRYGILTAYSSSSLLIWAYWCPALSDAYYRLDRSSRVVVEPDIHHLFPASNVELFGPLQPPLQQTFHTSNIKQAKMSSQQGTQGPPVSDVNFSHLLRITNHTQAGASGQAGRGPPYAPLNAGLGGTPMIVPDVPVSVVLLILYLMFGIIHIKILKGNKGRGHKFIFNGAILGILPPHPPIGMAAANMSQVSARFESLQCPCG